MQIAELCKSVMMNQTDEALVQEMAQGSEQAFVEIYKRRQPAIYRYALQMSGSQSAAEDISQEVFMIFIQQVRNFDSQQGTVSAYLYGIARKCFLRFRGKIKLEIVSLDQPSIENQPHLEPSSTGNPFNDVAKGEEMKLMKIAILTLPERFREALILCDLHEMSYAEAAVITGCPEGTIRSRLHRGRKMLLHKLNDRLRRQPGSNKKEGGTSYEMCPL